MFCVHFGTIILAHEGKAEGVCWCVPITYRGLLVLLVPERSMLVLNEQTEACLLLAVGHFFTFLGSGSEIMSVCFLL